MKLSLIIAVYQRDDFLCAVLESIGRQSFRDFEVIIAEDGQSDAIADAVRPFQDSFPFSLVHLTQEDRGFRKSKILNRAMAVARGEFFVFIDGDCLLHRHFLKEYARLALSGCCHFGRRVMLDGSMTDRIVKAGTSYGLSIFRMLASRSRKKEEALYFPLFRSSRKTGMLGCSFCVSRVNMQAINGFDEDFTQPFYGEDTDVERRLKLIGVRLVCSRYATVQYHMHHETGDRSQCWEVSERMFKEKSKENLPWCLNGLVKREHAQGV